MQGSVGYNLGFAAAVCLVCAVVVSSAAVVLGDRQKRNAALDRQRNVLLAVGLAADDESLDAEAVAARSAAVTPVVLTLSTGEVAADIDPVGFDQRAASIDSARSTAAPDNVAGIMRLPNEALVYEVRDEAGRLDSVVLPVEGLGLWGTLYGFVALEGDLGTIRGLTFYEHKETPGLGGEVDNPRWKALWPGRRAFDDDLSPAIAVVKGPAGSVDEAPYAIDGLSGATITSRGVTNLVQFWLGPDGFGPYLTRLRNQPSASRTARTAGGLVGRQSLRRRSFAPAKLPTRPQGRAATISGARCLRRERCRRLVGLVGRQSEPQATIFGLGGAG